VIGGSGIPKPEPIRVQAINLSFLGAGLFGPPRDKSERQPGWTAGSCKFGIYANLPGHGQHHIVILRSNGSGLCGYIDVSLCAAEMWRHLCARCSPEMLWNICSCVTSTHDLACGKGRQQVMDIFAEGRLKKRRRQGLVQVYIQAKIMEPRCAPS
jgi:hypothetical protein